MFCFIIDVTLHNYIKNGESFLLSRTTNIQQITHPGPTLTNPSLSHLFLIIFIFLFLNFNLEGRRIYLISSFHQRFSLIDMGSNLCCSRHPETYESTTGNTGDRSLPTGDDKLLSYASTLSVKEQESQLKAARLEEQRLGREAEKVNSWVKHESARFDHLP